MERMYSKMDEIRVLTPTGMLGYGFPLEDFKEGLKRNPKENVAEHFKDTGKEYELIFHIYGKNGVMGEYEPDKNAIPHELGIVAEAAAGDQKTANAVCSKARTTLLHYNYEGRKATLVRPRPQASIGETDMHACQQHVPLLSIEIPWKD